MKDRLPGATLTISIAPLNEVFHFLQRSQSKMPGAVPMKRAWRAIDSSFILPTSSFRAVAGLVLAIGGVELVRDPERAPGWVLGGLVTAVWPLAVAWRAARGTALRAAVAWGALAVILGIV